MVSLLNNRIESFLFRVDYFNLFFSPDCSLVNMVVLVVIFDYRFFWSGLHRRKKKLIKQWTALNPWKEHVKTINAYCVYLSVSIDVIFKTFRGKIVSFIEVNKIHRSERKKNVHNFVFKVHVWVTYVKWYQRKVVYLWMYPNMR